MNLGAWIIWVPFSVMLWATGTPLDDVGGWLNAALIDFSAANCP